MRVIRFRSIIAILMVVLLTATVSVLLWVNAQFFRRSVMTLANAIIEQTLARVELRVQQLINQAVTINHQTLRLIQDVEFSREDFTLLENFFAKSLEVQEGLKSIGLALEATGEYIMAERLGNGGIHVREYARNEQGQIQISDFQWEGSQRKLLSHRASDGYDPRQRPFYVVASQKKSGAWTKAYPFWRDNEHPPMLGLSYASPWHGPNGNLVGVVNADFELNALCSFLSVLEAELPGYAIVIEETAPETFRLLAHPHPESMFTDGALNPPTRLEDINDTVVAGYLRSLREDLNELKDEEHGRRFQVGKDWFLGAYRRLDEASQPPWILAMVIPQEAITGGIVANVIWSLVSSLGCLTLALLFALWFSRRMARPLQELSAEAESVGHLEFGPARFTESHICEVRQLQQSMTEMKASLRSFRKFVPADLVHQLIASGAEAQLGGQQRVLTIFFSDIVAFTSLSEKLQPQELVTHMGQYLSEISQIIHQYRGTLDKYIGDGVMAFWGAPQGNPDHATDACRAAWAFQKRLGQLSQQWMAQGKPALRTRIGLHTGEVIVGNIGSETRMNYTLIGDAVNLASRMEGLNKYFGTSILISESTRAAAGESILARPINRVVVQGKIHGALVYEMLGMAPPGAPEQLELIERTERAFAKLEARQFSRARELYEAILQDHPHDPVAKFQVERCAEFESSPVDSDTDTIYRARAK